MFNSEPTRSANIHWVHSCVLFLCLLVCVLYIYRKVKKSQDYDTTIRLAQYLVLFTSHNSRMCSNSRMCRPDTRISWLYAAWASVLLVVLILCLVLPNVCETTVFCDGTFVDVWANVSSGEGPVSIIIEQLCINNATHHRIPITKLKSCVLKKLTAVIIGFTVVGGNLALIITTCVVRNYEYIFGPYVDDAKLAFKGHTSPRPADLELADLEVVRVEQLL